MTYFLINSQNLKNKIFNEENLTSELYGCSAINSLTTVSSLTSGERSF